MRHVIINEWFLSETSQGKSFQNSTKKGKMIPCKADTKDGVAINFKVIEITNKKGYTVSMIVPGQDDGILVMGKIKGVGSSPVNTNYIPEGNIDTRIIDKSAVFVGVLKEGKCYLFQNSLQYGGSRTYSLNDWNNNEPIKQGEEVIKITNIDNVLVWERKFWSDGEWGKDPNYKGQNKPIIQIAPEGEKFQRLEF